MTLYYFDHIRHLSPDGSGHVSQVSYTGWVGLHPWRLLLDEQKSRSLSSYGCCLRVVCW